MDDHQQQTLNGIYNRLAEAKMGTVLDLDTGRRFRPFVPDFLQIRQNKDEFNVMIAGPGQHRAHWAKMAARALDGLENVKVTDTGLPTLARSLDRLAL